MAQIVRAMDEGRGTSIAARWQIGLGTKTQDQLAAAEHEPLAGHGVLAGDEIAVAFGIVQYALYIAAETQVRQACSYPLAIAGVLGAAQVMVLAHVVGINAVGEFAIVQIAIFAAWVGQTDQIGEKRVLQSGRLDQHAWMPIKAGFLVQEERAHPRKGADRLARLRLKGPIPIATKS